MKADVCVRCGRCLFTMGLGLVATLSIAGGQALAGQPAVDPSINAPYENPDIGYWRSVFESDRREIYAHRHEILAALDLRPGMAVADVGAGTGFFSLMFAERVGPKGRVYAVDIAPRFVDALEKRAAAADLDNVVGVVNEPRDVMLPPHSIDLAFISDSYHHFEFPAETMRSISRALRPGGAVVIVDFRRVPGLSNLWVMDHVRAGADTVRSEMAAEGFEFVEERDLMQTQYYLRFRRKDAYTDNGTAAHGSVEFRTE